MRRIPEALLTVTPMIMGGTDPWGLPCQSDRDQTALKRSEENWPDATEHEPCR
jgi:hypothetical protein